MAIGNTIRRLLRTWALMDTPYANQNDPNNETGWSLNQQWQAIEDKIYGLSFQNSVTSFLNTPPGEPLVGERYIIGVGTGDWKDKDNQIAERIFEAWVYESPTTGMVCYINTKARIYVYAAGAWQKLILHIADTVLGELLGGLSNGENKVFTFLNSYVSGKIKLYMGSLNSMVRIFDFTESADKQITLTGRAPTEEERLRADYIKE